MSPQVNVPKTRRTYCKGKDCKKHTQHKGQSSKHAPASTAILTYQKSHNTRQARPRSSPRESVVTTASSPDTVVRPSPYSTRRQRRPRRWCFVSSACSARPRPSWRSSDASTLSSVVTRRQRVRRWSSRRLASLLLRECSGIWGSVFFAWSVSRESKMLNMGRRGMWRREDDIA